MRISDWSSDVCSSDLGAADARGGAHATGAAASAYSLGSLGKCGGSAVAGGLSAVGQTAAGSAVKAALSPLNNAAGNACASMKSTFSLGERAGFTQSGGKISGRSENSRQGQRCEQTR